MKLEILEKTYMPKALTYLIYRAILTIGILLIFIHKGFAGGFHNETIASQANYSSNYTYLPLIEIAVK